MEWQVLKAGGKVLYIKTLGDDKIPMGNRKYNMPTARYNKRHEIN